MNFRERRKLGLTIRDLARRARQLKEDGLWDATQPSLMAAMLFETAVEANPEAWTEAGPGLDWDKILAFIEALIPLIALIIKLFGL